MNAHDSILANDADEYRSAQAADVFSGWGTESRSLAHGEDAPTSDEEAQ